MGVLASLWQVVTYLVTMASVYAAVWLFVRRMPTRPGIGWRATAFAIVHLGIAVALSANLRQIGPSVYQVSELTSISTFITLGCFYVALPLLVLFFYVCPIWDAVFCAAAGYTLQNLGSSVNELARAVSGLQPNMGGSPLGMSMSAAGYLVVYLLCDRTFIDRASRMGLGHGSRRYVVPLLAVMVVVIFFDTQVKYLAFVGPADTALALRVAHVATCAFTLYAEYQIAYVGHLSAEVAAERSMREGEERLWEVSRQNVAAINARVHDMRHQVARTLAQAEGGVDRATLAQVAREISIYDASVRTGNSALDTILSEKGLICEREGIQLSVIADGGVVARVPDADLFALMGTLVDAAASVALALADPERRRISLQVREVAGMTAIHVSCPAPSGATVPRLDETRRIVSRLDGAISSRVADGELSLDVLLPLSRPTVS